MIIGFFLPSTIASQLALPDGENADALHLTLAFLGDMAANDDLVELTRQFAAGNQPITARINGIARFTGNDEQDALVALVDSPELPEFRQNLIEFLIDNGVEPVLNHGFIPHVTLAYIKPEAPLPIETIEPVDIIFDTLSLDLGSLETEGEKHSFPLGEVKRGFMNKITELWEQFRSLVEREVIKDRAIKEADSWDGDAGRWDTAESYCASCLIDVSGDEKAKDRCFLPVKDPGESAYNSQAIKAAAGGRGISRVKKPADVSQDDWDSAVKGAAGTIARLYKEMEMEVPTSVEAKMRAMDMGTMDMMAYRKVEEMNPQMMYRGVFVDEGGGMFCLCSMDNKLYRCPITLENGEVAMGEMQEVTQEFVPKTRTIISRQADGQVRWLSISATATINKDGEIDSRQLFDNFVKRAGETGQYPERIFYHQRGQKYVVGQADFLARSGNCYITGGVYNDSPLARSEIKAREHSPDQWGDSIGYIPMGPVEFIKVRGFDIPVYQDGINVEISTLPAKEASSLFIRTEVQRSMNERQLQALADLHFEGDIERAKKWIEETPDEVNRQIDQRGLVTRAAAEGEQAAPEFELTDEAIEIIVTRAMGAEVIRAQQTKLDALRQAQDAAAQTAQTLAEKLASVETALAQVERRLKEVEATDLEKRRQMAQDLPAAAIVPRLTYRPSVERGQEQVVQPDGKQVAEKTLDGIGLTY